jgi:uncharacterized protein Yka (UPF0111/DUF47 family)
MMVRIIINLYLYICQISTLFGYCVVMVFPLGFESMNKNKIMLGNLIDLAKVSLEMQEQVNTVFAGNDTAKTQALAALKALTTKSETLVIKAESDLANSFFLFIDKDDMMQFVTVLEETNTDLYKLASRRLLASNLVPKHAFNQELTLQKQAISEIAKVINTLSEKYKFSELKGSLKTLKAIRSTTDNKISDSIKNILAEQKYDTVGTQIWERETLQTFENIFDKCSKFSTKLSEFIVKYE